MILLPCQIVIWLQSLININQCLAKLSFLEFFCSKCSRYCWKIMKNGPNPTIKRHHKSHRSTVFKKKQFAFFNRKKTVFYSSCISSLVVMTIVSLLPMWFAFCFAHIMCDKRQNSKISIKRLFSIFKFRKIEKNSFIFQDWKLKWWIPSEV